MNDSKPILSDVNNQEAIAYAQTLRDEIIISVSKTGGHLASSLGAVDITVALHRVFDTSRDRLVFDVGHQCYAHKIITGRGAHMNSLRQFGGISGFPKPHESVHDAFVAGHASAAVSTALGMARARTLQKEDYHVVAFLGDGALTGGLAYEGLCDAGSSKEKMIVILNDNGMSITKNVGGVASMLAKQRLKPQYLSFKKGYRKIMKLMPFGQHIYRITHQLKKNIKDILLPTSLFEGMGFQYLGPVDGHDIKRMTELLQYAKEMEEQPVLIHIRTTKGLGYAPAVYTPDAYHGVGPFDIATGAPRKQSGRSFSTIFSETLCTLAQQDTRICAVTAAMEAGTGLERFRKRFPKRFFDVGIAEGHAVTMAAGMAKQGMIPVFAVYSTFFQRSYDMLLHDIALLNLHVIFAVDRAGLVGEDGETHHGVFDVAFLDNVPGMTVLAPSTEQELSAMLRYAVEKQSGPVAIRYPRGGEPAGHVIKPVQTPAVRLRSGNDLTLIGYGTMVQRLLNVSERIKQRGYTADVIKLNQITPLDTLELFSSLKKTGRGLIVEEVVESGSVAQRLSLALSRNGLPVQLYAKNLGNHFVSQGSVDQLHRLCGLDEDSISRETMQLLEGDSYGRATS